MMKCHCQNVTKTIKVFDKDVAEALVTATYMARAGFAGLRLVFALRHRYGPRLWSEPPAKRGLKWFDWEVAYVRDGLLHVPWNEDPDKARTWWELCVDPAKIPKTGIAEIPATEPQPVLVESEMKAAYEADVGIGISEKRFKECLEGATKAVREGKDGKDGYAPTLLRVDNVDNEVNRLIVVGDIHGHDWALEGVLREIGAEETLRNSGTHMVLLGDVIDGSLIYANSPARFIKNGRVGARLLYRIAYLKKEFRDNSHILAGNTELGFGSKCVDS